MKIKLDDGAYMPIRAHATDAGLDLITPRKVTVPIRGSAVIDTGVHLDIPHGTYGKIESKSGLNIKHNIVACGGVIDEGYIGSIHVKLYNHGDDNFVFEKGQKIAQLIIQPCLYEIIEVTDKLEETERGDKGFGSTGS